MAVIRPANRIRLGAITVSGSSGFFADDFPLTQNPYTGRGQGLGGASFFGDWKDVQTSPGKCFGSYLIQESDDYLDSFIVFDTGSADHYVEAVIYRSSAGYNAGVTHEAQLIVRAGGTDGDVEMWEVISEHQSTSSQLVHWDGPLNSVTPDSYSTGDGGLGATPQDGDVFRFEAVGNTLTVKWNGATVGTKSTSLYNTNTMAGIMFFPRQGATLANFGFKSIEVGPL